MKKITISDVGTASVALLTEDNAVIEVRSGGCPVVALLTGIKHDDGALEADIWDHWTDGYDGNPDENRLSIEIEDAPWEQLGHTGKHNDHHLHTDDMQDVYCQECQEFLADAEAAIAWPMEKR